MKSNRQYYEGMFGSLKHNIILMLNQIEGNIAYSEGTDILEDLTFIQKKVRKVKRKMKLCSQTTRKVKHG